jgi:hypothetical protein
MFNGKRTTREELRKIESKTTLETLQKRYSGKTIKENMKIFFKS